jgi:glycosyltransferase involved in cell wall biosynthesis
MISIILPTYNRLYSLKSIFLPSLENQDYTDYELIVIDDNSSDDTQRYFTKELRDSFPKVAGRTVYTKNRLNEGAPASRNKGAHIASGKWLLIVEDDIQLCGNNFLTKANEILIKSANNIAVVSPQRYDSVANGYYSNVDNNFSRVGRLSAEVYIDNSQKYTGIVPTTHASSFILKDVFLRHGTDSINFHGNTFRDETNIYKNITDNNFLILYVGDQLQMLHRNDFAKEGGQKKVKKMSILKQEHMIWSNHFIYLNKHYSFPKLRIIVFVFVRASKIISNITHVYAIKNILSLWLI